MDILLHKESNMKKRTKSLKHPSSRTPGITCYASDIDLRTTDSVYNITSVKLHFFRKKNSYTYGYID